MGGDYIIEIPGFGRRDIGRSRGGVRRKYPIGYTFGEFREIIETDDRRDRRSLSRNSQLAVQSSPSIWKKTGPNPLQKHGEAT